MLIEFQVENYLSYRDPMTLSMLASRQVSEYWDDNVIATERIPLLKTAVIYGANASGKSNLIAAIAYMRWFVINSSKEGQADEAIFVTPFKLDTSTEDAPSRFEAVCIVNGIRYRYGFQVDRSVVISEWLFEARRDKEKALFLREGDSIDVRSGFAEGGGIEDKTRDNALFLSVVANFNGKVAGSIIKWFHDLTVARGLRDEMQYAFVSKRMILDENRRGKLIELVRNADLGIEGIAVSEEEFDAGPAYEILPKKMMSLAAVHTKYSDGEPVGTVPMDFDAEESEGTRKFFRVVGPVLECLEKGSVLVVDELEAKLHPLLTRMIVRLFHSDVSNPNNAQLIFATHDTNLLEHVSFRRDQIWFAEKDQRQATDLYSLAEIKIPREDGSDRKVRKDARYGKDYFKGKYGAIPYLGEFDKLFTHQGESIDG